MKELWLEKDAYVGGISCFGCISVVGLHKKVLMSFLDMHVSRKHSAVI